MAALQNLILNLQGIEDAHQPRAELVLWELYFDFPPHAARLGWLCGERGLSVCSSGMLVQGKGGLLKLVGCENILLYFLTSAWLRGEYEGVFLDFAFAF